MINKIWNIIVVAHVVGFVVSVVGSFSCVPATPDAKSAFDDVAYALTPAALADFDVDARERMDTWVNEGGVVGDAVTETPVTFTDDDGRPKATPSECVFFDGNNDEMTLQNSAKEVPAFETGLFHVVMVVRIDELFTDGDGDPVLFQTMSGDNISLDNFNGLIVRLTEDKHVRVDMRGVIAASAHPTFVSQFRVQTPESGTELAPFTCIEMFGDGNNVSLSVDCGKTTETFVLPVGRTAGDSDWTLMGSPGSTRNTKGCVRSLYVWPRQLDKEERAEVTEAVL